MKRWISLLLAFLMAATWLVGCTGEALPNTPDNPDQPAQPEQPENPKQPEEEEGDEPKIMELRIGSYNIANGKYVDHDLSVLADDILDQDLDIVGLQEVDRLATRSKYIDTMADLADLTGYDYYYFVKAINLAGDEATYGQKGEYGIGILSKYPIVEQNCYALDSQGKEQRMLAHAQIDVNGTMINFFNTHLSFEDSSIRENQFMEVDDIIFRYDHAFLTGDFNLSSLEEMDALSLMKSVNTTENPLVTFSGGTCIDNICYTKDIQPVEAYVVNDVKHSDHYMLVGSFTITLK